MADADGRTVRETVGGYSTEISPCFRSLRGSKILYGGGRRPACPQSSASSRRRSRRGEGLHSNPAQPCPSKPDRLTLALARPGPLLHMCPVGLFPCPHASNSNYPKQATMREPLTASPPVHMRERNRHIIRVLSHSSLPYLQVSTWRSARRSRISTCSTCRSSATRVFRCACS